MVWWRFGVVWGVSMDPCFPCMIGFVFGPGCAVRFIPLLFQLISCADPDTLTTFFFSFLVNEGREDPNSTKSGPYSARKRNAIQMAFRWRANDCPTLNAGLVAW